MSASARAASLACAPLLRSRNICTLPLSPNLAFSPVPFLRASLPAPTSTTFRARIHAAESPHLLSQSGRGAIVDRVLLRGSALSPRVPPAAEGLRGICGTSPRLATSAAAGAARRGSHPLKAVMAQAGNGGSGEQGEASGERNVAPFGAWESPIGADMASGASLRFGGAMVDSEGRLVWAEGRPTEKGRVVVVREGTRGATPLDISPPSMNVRSRVHEYGGGAFLVAPSPPPATSDATSAGCGVEGDLLIFSNGSDQRLYSLQLTSSGPDAAEASHPKPLTPVVEPPGTLRFADGRLDMRRRRVICVQEDHRPPSETAAPSESSNHRPPSETAAPSESSGSGGTEEHGGHGEPSNMIVAVSLDGDGPEGPLMLASGADFYASPRVSPDGTQLAWVEWSHPHMPWERSRVMVGTFGDSGLLSSVQCVAGADDSILEAPMEPLWSQEDDLYFLSDRFSGFWSLHRWNPASATVEVVAEMPKQDGAELMVEVGGPLWVFGNASYGFIPDSPHHVAAICQVKGQSQLAIINTLTRSFTLTPPSDPPLTQMSHLVAGKDRLFVCAGGPSTPLSFYELKPSPDMASLHVLLPPIRASTAIDTASLTPFLSSPQWIEFPTTTPGQENTHSVPPRTAHALFYPPKNGNFRGPDGSLPPLLLKCHGGPTGCLDSALRLPLQFWTSRGFAVVDVNYGGSTGYGREYRERLHGQWGVVDVDDACSCVEYLVRSGLVDGSKVAIDGSSAGGFTTLSALTFRSVFRAGCSLYGIGDLEALALMMHKFEKHYTDTLVAPYSTPEGKQLYQDRSPIKHVDKLACPLLLLQGLKDQVVSPDQARAMDAAVKAKGLPVAIVEFPDEDHGFRNADNIKAALEMEHEFFCRVLLNLPLPPSKRRLTIANFDEDT
ncbi:hypothetical protein CLOP_g5683 [Closterium sp. NIES-67]|nr:hypothetical protein CLOP_g5683 [Closterium sp. NIES-67]